MLEQGVIHEGVRDETRHIIVNAIYQGLAYPVTAGVPAHVDLPITTASGWRPVSFVSPGWDEVKINFPPATPGKDTVVGQPIRLRRSVTSLTLRMPEGGSDYDEASLVWVGTLEGEPAATPPDVPLGVRLEIKGSHVLDVVPTGVYSLVLRSGHVGRVKEFVIDPAVQCVAKKGADAFRLYSIPPSLSRKWVSFAAVAPDGGRKGPTAGMFCRLNIDIRANGGDMAMAMQPLVTGQTLHFADLKPRPDTVWPVSNVLLIDPTRVEFDCPFSHADHHFVLTSADGFVTLKGEMLSVENPAMRDEMFERMKTLIQKQALFGGQNRSFFDPAYAGLTAQQLPNFAELASPQEFAGHLRRISRSPLTAIELGESVVVGKTSDGSWHVKAKTTK